MIVIRYIMITFGLLLVGAMAGSGTRPIDLDRSTKTPIRMSTTMVFRVDGGEPRRLPVEGVSSKDGMRFQGTRRVEDLGVVLAWDWIADLDPRGGGARIVGTFGLLNDTDREREFEVRVDFPLDPLIADASRLGGTVRATLVMNDDGGRVELPAGDALFSVLIDGKVVRRLHAGPFAMGGGDSGTAVADASFGAPYPSYETPAINDALGIRNRFGLSARDQVQFRCELTVAGDPADFIRRRPTDPVRIQDRDDRLVIDVDGRGKRKPGRGTVSRSGKGASPKTGRRITFD
ncbi:MAG: hypothetical protein GY895_14115 [Phycisphaera sp.]|nr:hypothetical protein [Phycisphaera sp.]